MSDLLAMLQTTNEVFSAGFKTATDIANLTIARQDTYIKKLEADNEKLRRALRKPKANE